MPASRDLTVTTTNDRQNMMCAIRIVPKPSEPEKPAETKSASSDEPSTISGAAIGRKISRFVDDRNAKLQRTSANAASVPRIVDTIVARNPIWMLFQSASHMPSAPQKFVQLSRVKPSNR